MADIAVVILNFNGVRFLRDFLPSVVKYSRSADIIVVDNNSTDDSVALVSSTFPEIELVKYDENLGYTGGYNRALGELNHDYCVLLNSDIEVTDNWLTPIVDYMDKHKEVAACQPKILDYKNKNQFEYAGAAGGYIDAFGFPYCRGRVFDTHEIDQGQYDQNQAIFWATGACMFVRRKDFIKAGGFDEDFFAHMEEIDLCWRFHHMGKTVHCIPESKVYHVGGGTLNKINPKKTYLNFRNNLSMFSKNESWLGIFWKSPIKLCLDMLAAIKLWKDHSFAHFIAVIKAHFDFWILFPKNMKKRLSFRKLKITQKTTSSSMLLPYVYFILGRKTYDEIHKNVK